MENVDKYLKIDDYINNRLSKEELIAFKKELFQNPELAQEVNINKNLYALYDSEDWTDINKLNKDGIYYQEYLLSDDAKKIKKAIKVANNKYRLNSISPFIYIKRYGIAASLVLLIGLAYTFENNDNSSSKLYKEFVSLSELPSLTNRSDADKLLSDTEELYLNKEYIRALRTLELYDEKYHKKPTNVLLYEGMCHLELNQFSKAKTIFNSIKNSNSLDKNKAYWYLAATSLKQEDIDTSKNILQLIVDNSYFNHRKAKDLLTKIN